MIRFLQLFWKLQTPEKKKHISLWKGTPLETNMTLEKQPEDVSSDKKNVIFQFSGVHTLKTTIWGDFGKSIIWGYKLQSKYTKNHTSSDTSL